MIRGKQIKQRREVCGLTQAELAEKMLVSVQAVSQWENDKTQPDSARILLLARALNTTTDALLDDAEQVAYNWQLGDQMFSEEHMYSKLKAFAQTENLAQTYRALPYMRQSHDGQIRKPPKGSRQRIPYIFHPLTMACHAHAMGIRDDTVLAAALLHDVCEDCGVAPDDLPFSPDVRETVRLLTKQPARFQAIGQEAALAEYYAAMQSSQRAILVKCLDRCNNLSTMASSFSTERMAEYITETESYILPMLEDLKRESTAWSDVAFLLKYQILSLIETQKALLMRG